MTKAQSGRLPQQAAALPPGEMRAVRRASAGERSADAEQAAKAATPETKRRDGSASRPFCGAASRAVCGSCGYAAASRTH